VPAKTWPCHDTWPTGIFGIVGGIVAIAVGFGNMVSRPGATMTLTHLNLLYGGPILMLVSMIYPRWVMARLVRAARVGAAVSLLVLLYVSLLVPGIVATGVLAAVLVVVETRWPTFASWGGTQLADTDG
jgi:low temperature requirement protein LtrA